MPLFRETARFRPAARRAHPAGTRPPTACAGVAGVGRGALPPLVVGAVLFVAALLACILALYIPNTARSLSPIRCGVRASIRASHARNPGSNPGIGSPNFLALSAPSAGGLRGRGGLRGVRPPLLFARGVLLRDVGAARGWGACSAQPACDGGPPAAWGPQTRLGRRLGARWGQVAMWRRMTSAEV